MAPFFSSFPATYSIPHSTRLFLLLVVLGRSYSCHALVSVPPVGANGKSAPGTSALALPTKILILGDTGFLGRQIVEQLEALPKEVVTYVTASKSCTGLDLTASDAAAQVETLAKGCDAVISTVGSIGQENDEQVNAANGQAALGAKQAGVQRFVTIGNDPKVRDFTKILPMLRNYAKGKEQAETKIRELFPDSYTIIQPSFMHGGDKFSANPPRVPANVGQVAEDILGLYPLQAASEALPGVLGILLQAPISRDRVAAAAINAALGVSTGGSLSSREEIILAASKRVPKMVKAVPSQEERNAMVKEFKQQIYDMGDCESDSVCLLSAFEVLEEIEALNARRPASDPLLNGRWDFVFDIEADMGTGVIKDILTPGESKSPNFLNLIFDMHDVYMEIGELNSQVNIFIQIKLLLGTIPMNLKLTTDIVPEPKDETGTRFLEHFAGIELMGKAISVPEEWQRSRPLEFSYLDETMLIARGNGGEPHYLKRDDCTTVE